MGEAGPLIRLGNSGSRPVRLWIEPWCTEHELQPGRAVLIETEAETSIEWTDEEDLLVIWGASERVRDADTTIEIAPDDPATPLRNRTFLLRLAALSAVVLSGCVAFTWALFEFARRCFFLI